MKKLICTAGLLCCLQLTSSAQNINTIAGGGTAGLGDGGLATAAQLNSPHGIAFDAAGNIYLSDGNNNRIRKIAVGTGIITTFAGNGSLTYNGDGIMATSASINPFGITLDAAGNIYIADATHNLVRKITAATGLISRIAGIAPSGPNGGYNGDGIPADSAKLRNPMDVAVDAAGNIYIADYYNDRVRKVTVSTGIISTIAGTGSNSYNGDGIAANTANLFGPMGIALDAAGNIYIAENENYRVRKITASTGLISTIAGNGGTGSSGDGSAATAAQLKPSGIRLDASGNIYVTDVQNSVIRKINASTGIITTIAGTGTNGYNGDGIPSITAQISSPTNVAIDNAGNIYISDSGNNRLREIGAGSTTGIYNIISAHNNLNIYPNPFCTQAILDFSEEQKNVTVKINDISGREIKCTPFSGKQFIIEKGDLKAGVYFVQTLSADKITGNQKIIIE